MADSQVTAQADQYQCKSCERSLGANDFYASNQSKCKECVKRDVRRNREQRADYYRAYDRKRYRDSDERKSAARRSADSPAGIEARKRSAVKSRTENPAKFKARNAVSNALRDGKLERASNCYFCRSGEKLHAHHEDYDHPLDVVWLCPSCHGKLHTIKGDFRRAGVK